MSRSDPFDPTAPSDEGFRRWISFAIGFGIVGSLVSISVSYIFFRVALLLWIIHCIISGKLHLKVPPFFAFVLAFVAASVASIIFSSDVSNSVPSLREHIRFFWILMIFTYLGRRQAERIDHGIAPRSGLTCHLRPSLRSRKENVAGLGPVTLSAAPISLRNVSAARLPLSKR